MNDDFVPRRVRERSEREEKLLAGLGAAAELLEDDAEVRRGLFDVLGSVLAMRHVETDDHRVALRAIDRVMGALVDFDERCEAGDVAGAVGQLRGWIRRLGA